MTINIDLIYTDMITRKYIIYQLRNYIKHIHFKMYKIQEINLEFNLGFGYI